MLRRAIGLPLLLLCLFLSAGCGSADTGQRVTYLDVFDTVTRITVYGLDEAQFSSDAGRLHALLVELHRLCDIYHSYPGTDGLAALNAQAGGEPVVLDRRLIDLLTFGLEVSERTRGRVDIVSGALLRPWHDARAAAAADPEGAVLPDAALLREAAGHIGAPLLQIDTAAATARLTDPAASVDVGAIAKGWAAEHAARFAKEELGWTGALIDLGGNVRAIGGKDGQRSFTVGIADPDGSGHLMALSVRDAAVVTSGDYQRYMTVGGKRYAHIIDPATLYPAEHMRAVTVICADSGVADALSTALFLLPVEQGAAWVEQQPGIEAVWVKNDGTLQCSSGIAAYRAD